MSASIQLERIDQARWRELTPSFTDFNYRQLSAFGVACADRRGAESECLALRRGDEVVALANVRLKRLPLLCGGMAYLTGGPLVRRQGEDDDVAVGHLSAMLDALRLEYAQRRGLVMRVRPAPGPASWSDIAISSFEAAGYALTPGATPERSMLLHLEGSDDELRAGFAQKWRNGLNASQRAGLTIRRAESDDDWRRFIALHDALRATKGFEVDLNASFYGQVQRRLESRDRFDLMLAELNGRPVAGHLSSSLGDTCIYLLGAANDEGRRTKASYLLQWHALVNAARRGMTCYDLGGVDREGNPGVHRFKRGMGGVELAAPGPFQAMPGALSRWITSGAERVWRSCRTRKRPKANCSKTAGTSRAA